MAIGAGKLRNRVAIPIQFQPAEPVENGANRLLVVAFAVGIFNAQQKFALTAFGVQPIEQRCPGPADMKVAGGRRRKAHNR